MFSGKQEAAEATLEALKVVPEPLGKWASILVEICAYAGKSHPFKSFEKSINCTRIVELTNLLVEESFIIHNTLERLNCFYLFVCFLKLTWSLF